MNFFLDMPDTPAKIFMRKAGVNGSVIITVKLAKEIF